MPLARKGSDAAPSHAQAVVGGARSSAAFQPIERGVHKVAPTPPLSVRAGLGTGFGLSVCATGLLPLTTAARLSVRSESIEDPFLESLAASMLEGGAESSTLTSPEFRVRCDQDRADTASAPPGARPPPKTSLPRVGEPSALVPDEDEDMDEDEDEAMCSVPHREAQSAPVRRPPPAAGSAGARRGFDLLGPARDADRHSRSDEDEVEEEEAPSSRRPPMRSCRR